MFFYRVIEEEGALLDLQFQHVVSSVELGFLHFLQIQFLFCNASNPII
jgi:hypothetical protein